VTTTRGSIKGWIQNDTLGKDRFSKVFVAADTILKAGRLSHYSNP